VRCSSCELLLDRYVEGTLTPREMARVGTHLRACSHCASLLAELRVVDALLATTKPVELAPNFTFAVMAEAASVPIHATRRLSLWAVLSFYLIAAWLALSGIYVVLGDRLAHLGTLGRQFAESGSQGLAAVTATAQSVSPATPLVVGGVFGVLMLDAALAVVAVFAYRAARFRLAAHPSGPEVV